MLVSIADFQEKLMWLMYPSQISLLSGYTQQSHTVAPHHSPTPQIRTTDHSGNTHCSSTAQSHSTYLHCRFTAQIQLQMHAEPCLSQESTGQDNSVSWWIEYLRLEPTWEVFTAVYSGLCWPVGWELSFNQVMQAGYAISTW